MTDLAARLRALAAKLKEAAVYDYYPIYAADLSTLEGAAAELDRLQTVAALFKYLEHPVNGLKPALDQWVSVVTRAEKAEAAAKEQAAKLKELERNARELEEVKERAATYKKMLHFSEIRLDAALDILDRCIVSKGVAEQNPPAPADGTPRE